MSSTFCYSYPQCHSISHSFTRSTDSHVNIAGILHYRFHLYRSGLLDPLDMFAVFYSIQVNEYNCQQNTGELGHSILKEHSNQHDHHDPILHRQEHRNRGGIFRPCILFNSAKGFTASTNPFSAMLELLLTSL